MFLAELHRKSSSRGTENRKDFLEPVLTLKKEETKAAQVTNFDLGESFCLKKQKDSFKDDVPTKDTTVVNGWIKDNDIKIVAEDFPSSTEANLEWSRPLVEVGSANSMDFEYGKAYQLYISYFLGKPGAEATSTNHVFGAQDDGKGAPTWQTIYINTLKDLP